MDVFGDCGSRATEWDIVVYIEPEQANLDLQPNGSKLPLASTNPWTSRPLPPFPVRLPASVSPSLSYRVCKAK